MVCLLHKPARVYRPRQPLESDFHRLIRQHFDDFRALYAERYARTFGFWRPVFDKAIREFLKWISGNTIQIKLRPRGVEAALDGPAGDTDPNVAYTWGYGLSGSAASHARLEKITLPGGRQVYYKYEDANAFMSLGRVANIAANGSPAAGDKYVAYKKTPHPPAEPPASPRSIRKIKFPIRSDYQ